MWPIARPYRDAIPKDLIMRVHYDHEADAIYIKLGNQKPDGVMEISEGVSLDTKKDGEIIGIEILKASQKMNIRTMFYGLLAPIGLKNRFPVRPEPPSSGRAVGYGDKTSRTLFLARYHHHIQEKGR